MRPFSEYHDKYRHVKMERHDGILQMLLHTNDGPLQWGPSSQDELVKVFTEVGADRENRVIIMAGVGDVFSGPKAAPGRSFYKELKDPITADLLDRTHWNAKRLLTRLLDIEVPMIAVVNGPAMRHSEIPLTCDIVLAADDASFEDTAHFQIASQVPGDGINMVYTLLLGINRARYFMLMGEIIGAQQAKELGLVGEVMPRAQLLPRAWEIARMLAKKNDLLLRYSRIVLSQPLRNWLERDVAYHLGMESLAKLDKEDVHSDDEEIAQAEGAQPKG
ncbi:MAG TPA: enoyl-CoA hydratase/isomerase family protein [Burkholderiales bacterium]|nr:enoyl-CoA hydratase/isomerase family protein [Burkholderiales bacterium]